MNKTIRFLSLLALVGSISIGGTARAGVLDCKLKFTMSGWSIFYKRADGSGTVTCRQRLMCPGDGVMTLIACTTSEECPSTRPACTFLTGTAKGDFNVCE